LGQFSIMKKNKFTDKVKDKGTSELIGIVQSKSTFSDSLILAACWELESRNEIDKNSKSKMIQLESNIEKKKAIEEYRSTVIPPDLPRNIKFSAILLYGVFAVELVSILFFNRTTTVSFGAIVLPGSLLTFAVGIFIHLGKYWARIALFIVFGFSTLFFFLLISYADPFGITQQILTTVSVGFILTKTSREWYKKELPLTTNKANA
jgi:hypothetical protein